jgi:hypothetical protein
MSADISYFGCLLRMQNYPVDINLGTDRSLNAIPAAIMNEQVSLGSTQAKPYLVCISIGSL